MKPRNQERIVTGYMGRAADKLSLSVAACFFIAAFLTGCGSGTAHIKEADSLIENGSYAESLESLEAAEKAAAAKKAKAAAAKDTAAKAEAKA